MSLLASVSTTEIKARGSIKDGDVVRLRKAFSDDSRITLEDAQGLFALNDACPIQDPAWPPCFVDLMTDFVVDQIEPFGYLNADKSRWLRERLAVAGKVEGKVKLDLLISAIARSRWLPQSAAVFALEQVRLAIADGTGPLRAGKPISRLAVGEDDVDVLRQMLVACGGEGHVAISRAEAEVILDIDRLTAQADNHPRWREFFVAVIGGCMISASGYALASRQELLAADAWSHSGADLDNVMSGMSAGERSLVCAFRAMTREERAIDRLTQQKIGIVTREEIPAADAGWLADCLGQPGQQTPNVMAVLRLMKSEPCALDPRLQQLVQQAPAVAA